MYGGRRMTFSSFTEQPVLAALDHLAAVDKLTIFVGAGVSAEAGLPPWAELVRRLLEQAAKCAAFSTPEQGLEWAEKTLRTELPTGAAGIAETLLRDRLADVLYEELYRPVIDSTIAAKPSEFLPGPTAHAVAALRLACDDERRAHGKMKILTTNYDDLLERALKQAFRGRREDERAKNVVSMVWPLQRELTGDLTKVHHLHGLLTSRKPKGALTLTDTSFYRPDPKSHPRDSFVTGILNQSSCLFLGTSFTDPNLMRFIFASARDRMDTQQAKKPDRPRHIALMTHHSGDPRAVLDVREEIVRDRLRDSYVDCVFLDHYGDVSQFVLELKNQIRHPGGHSYAQRVSDWVRKLNNEVLFCDDTERFPVAQDRLNQRLVGILRETINETDRACRSQLCDEHIALAVWLFNESGTELTSWITTDRSHRDPALIRPVPVDPESRWLAVRAVCHGKSVHTGNENLDSRWRHIVGIPLRLDDGPRGSSCVGCMTVATLSSPQETWLRRLGRGEEKFHITLNRKVAATLASAISS